MATTRKALDIAAELVTALTIRFNAQSSPLAVALSYDTDQNPLIKVGTGSNGAAGGLIKIMPVAAPVATDVLGNTAIQYGPHVCMLAFEANNAAGAGADINTPAQFMPILGEALSRGLRVEYYNSTNGTAPSASTFVVANLKATFDNLFYPIVSGQ